MNLKSNSLMKIMSSTLQTLPAPKNISGLWNMGSLLFMCLILQIFTGILLATSYSAGMDSSFKLINQTMETTGPSWLTRYIHANGASLFFICLYVHIARGIYYSSYLFKHTWNVGVTILLLVMATAFLGYVLPVNQMSFWGASVITNLFSEIPYIGPDVVKLLWGETYVSDPTITRFFTFHFVLPFIILAMTLVHITLLHETGSNNPLGVPNPNTKMPFHPILSMKDMIGVLSVVPLFIMVNLYFPLSLGDDENFNPADMAVTPHHIQPEWYFLFAYAILRSIPNKMGGVIALLLSVTILYSMPLTHTSNMKSIALYPVNKIMFWFFIMVVLLLTWIGARPVEEPYVITGKIMTTLYFSYYLLNPLMMKLTDKLNTK
uniref:Cytochrome b n=1 Tax=Jesogammarus hinumensis TaxID=378308 RepID=A0A891ZJI4_9CRUS|nr:cytochrome b [Jesogammarus hinumensis]QRN71587.1 cytochrome b [Jesogammarus hinumensis]